MKKTILRKSTPPAGYTLIEIMLVLAIISILLGAGIYKLIGILDSAKEQRVEADIKTISVALSQYEMSNLFLPSTEQGMEALVRQPTSEPVPRRWRQLMESIPIDPWGMPYVYLNPGRRNPTKYDVYSRGPDRIESPDDIGNWER